MEGQVLNITPAVVWVIALTQLLTFALTVWNILSSGSRANATAIAAHSDTLSALDARLNTVELRINDGPSRKDFHELDLRMTKLGGSMEVLIERLKPIEAINERLQELMLEQGRK